MKRALLVIDFINEIVDPKGKLAAKGYASFIARHRTFDHLNTAIGAFRKAGDPVIFVRLAFDPSYSNQPKGSPVFGKAHEFGILADGTWSTEIHDAVDYKMNRDLTLVKTRVSAFHDTDLAKMLRRSGITDVYIAGVATDLAAEATARSAHDNDFTVYVVTDASAAANQADHEKSLHLLPKVAQLVTAAEL
ncbi:MAG TPA: isochorismatase family cysteine hydrolase [Candidatus Saccharimonadales bacterium]